MWHEGRLRARASAQHGLIGRDQLLALGVTDAEIQWRLGTGRIGLLHAGVYYLNATPATWKTDVLAGVLAAGPDALASHRCAGVLWGFDAVYGRMIEVTVPYLESPEPDGVILHRTRRPNQPSVVEGIPITSPNKTLLDLAPYFPERVLEKAARSAVRDGLTTADLMDREVAISGGRGVAGTRKFRRVVAAVAYDGSGSVAEIDLKHIVEEAPVPKPIQQMRVRLPGGDNAYPDFAWPDRGRIVEVDGFESHGDPAQFERDLERQNQLMDLGWEIRRFAAADIRKRPDWVGDELTRFVNKPFEPFEPIL
jgi:hypothetical protein